MSRCGAKVSAEVLRFPVNQPKPIAFDRHELSLILNLYGRYVASGDWKDYAMDFGRERAVFSVFHRTAEQPLYRIVKDPALARKQGQYSVIAQGGLILKRGHELAQVLGRAGQEAEALRRVSRSASRDRTRAMAMKPNATKGVAVMRPLSTMRPPATDPKD